MPNIVLEKTIFFDGLLFFRFSCKNTDAVIEIFSVVQTPASRLYLPYPVNFTRLKCKGAKRKQDPRAGRNNAGAVAIANRLRRAHRVVSLPRSN